MIQTAKIGMLAMAFGLLALGACDTSNNPDMSKPIQAFRLNQWDAAYDVDIEKAKWRIKQIASHGYPKEELEEFLAHISELHKYDDDKILPAEHPELWTGIDELYDEYKKLVADEKVKVWKLTVHQSELHHTYSSPKAAELDRELLELLIAEPEFTPEVKEILYQHIALSNRYTEGNEMVLEMCKRLRPKINFSHADYADFIRGCRQWADGDYGLLWEGAEDEENALRAARDLQEEFKDFTARYVMLGGDCIYGNCAIGWTARETSTKCIEVKDGVGCLSLGWDTSVSGGTITTRCNDGGCLQNGWTSKGPGGKWTVTCKDGGCLETGFILEKGKIRYEATCHGSCQSGGYSLIGPDELPWECGCGNGGCVVGGTMCYVQDLPTEEQVNYVSKLKK